MLRNTALNPYTVFLNPNPLSLCISYLSCNHINQWPSTIEKFIAQTPHI